MTRAVNYALDEFGIAVVCEEHAAMKLRGADRVEAVRRLSAQGLGRDDIAALVRTHPDMISRIQHQHHIAAAAHTSFTRWLHDN